jgi:hypothetical protein
MPTVAVSDLVVKDDDLVVGTQGRSVWILDDLTPIRQWSKAAETKAAHAFAPPPVVRWHRSDVVTDHQKVAAGDNPPAGAVVTFYLKERAIKPVAVEVLDEQNRPVARLIAKEKKPGQEDDDEEDDKDTEGPRKAEIPGDRGMNRFTWDLRHDGAEAIPNAKLDWGSARKGPVVAPGTYTAKITADGKTCQTTVEVRMDPRVTEPRGVSASRYPPQQLEVVPRVATPEEEARLAKAPWILRRNNLDVVRDEAKEQEQFCLRVRDDVTRLTRTVNELRAIRKQLDLHKELLEKQPRAKAFLKQGTDLSGKLDDLEAKLHNPKARVSYDILAQKGGARLYSQFVSLLQYAMTGDGPPTQGMKDLADALEADLDEQIEAFGRLKAEEVARLNELARKLNVPIIWIPARPKN